MKPNIYLTFDDGPSKNTVKIAQLLHDNGVQATFFMSGNNIQRFMSVPKKVSELGHTIGVHGSTHTFPNSMSLVEAFKEVKITTNLLHELTGVRPTLYRAPYGVLTRPLLKILKREGLKHVDWDKDTFDWKSAIRGEDLDVNKLVKMAENGSIMLFHDGVADPKKRESEARQGTNLLKALPKLIAELKKRGYEFRPIKKRIELRHNVKYFARTWMKHLRARFGRLKGKPTGFHGEATVMQQQLRNSLRKSKRK